MRQDQYFAKRDPQVVGWIIFTMIFLKNIFLNDATRSTNWNYRKWNFITESACTWMENF